MHPIRRKTLAIVGAGPKGLAVGVKSKVLAEFGIPVARVTLIEKNDIAANWTGEFGYTNGEMPLGTSPEKDVVFPIESQIGNPKLDGAIRKRLLDFTWSAYLIEKGIYSDWVDRGRPAPCHQRWSQYLHWVFDQIKDDISYIRGEVIAIEQIRDQWNICIDEISAGSSRKMVYDQVMVTGPGQLKSHFVDSPYHIKPPVYNLEEFWQALKQNEFKKRGRLAIIGSGENAASMLLALAKYAPDLDIEIISPRGLITTRAENFYENQVYSQPDRNNWADLVLADRRDFMNRTDTGVFSVLAMSILNDQRQHKIIPGVVIKLNRSEDGVQLTIEYGGVVKQNSYDQVILASGFDQASLLRKLLTKRSLVELQRAIHSDLTDENLALKVKRDLSLDGITAKLFVPMLAGLTQGPGFSNLSCLGRLSDRVLLTELGAKGQIFEQMIAPGSINEVVPPREQATEVSTSQEVEDAYQY